MEALLDQETLNTQFPKKSSDGNYMINALKESDPTTVSESTSTRISPTQTTVLTGKQSAADETVGVGVCVQSD